MALPKIIRKKGSNRSRHGIALDPLPDYYKNILLDNSLSAENFKTDDQFVNEIFKIAEMERSGKAKNKFYYNPTENSIQQYRDILESSKEIEWNCAICDKDILSEMSLFNMENFLCNKCQESHNKKNKTIDQRIIDSSFKFHTFCRKILIKQQKEFLKYIKHFETSYMRGRR